MYSRLMKSVCERAAPTLMGTVTIGSVLQETTPQSITATRLEYWEHDPADFDYYVSKPTVKDLPILLHKFDVEGLEVWPWIWTHPNNNGPHHVFVGISEDSLYEIQRLREESNQNNILVIASEEKLKEVAMKRNDPEIYERCQCGLVMDAKLELLNHDAKILMLDDEREMNDEKGIIVSIISGRKGKQNDLH